MKFRRYLLWCGILSSLLYAGMNTVIPLFWDEYDIASQTVSELSAVGAPTRPAWMWSIPLYTLLLVGFGWGLVKSGKKRTPLRIVGILIILHGLFGLFWPAMHLREVLAVGGGTMTDTLHMVWTAVTIPMMILEIVFGAAAFGRTFRYYSAVTILVMMGFGILTSIHVPAMEANQPTPLMGIWERINIAAYMLWVIVLAASLLRQKSR